MVDYYPDKWVVIQISTDDETRYPSYKVFGSWHGGYLDGDSWRMNSGIKSVSVDGDLILFEGFSGSTYHCHKDTYGMSSFASGVMANLIEKASVEVAILDEDTDWLNLGVLL